MKILDLVKTNYNILTVKIEFRKSDGKLTGMWNIGADTSYGMGKSYNTIPQWRLYELRKKYDNMNDIMDAFFKETEISINHRTSKKETWGYNGKLPKEVEQMEVGSWSCYSAYSRRNGVNGGYALHVTVISEIVNEEKETSEDVSYYQYNDDDQINIFDFI